MKLTMPIKTPKRSRKNPVALRKSAKKIQLRAPARRATEEDFDDYEEDEPTMRLSQAFIVVLLLHVIAVGGVLLFNYMKTRNEAAAKASKTIAAANASHTPTTASSKEESAVSKKETPKEPVKLTRPADGIYVVQAGDTLTQISTKFGMSIAAIEAENGLASQSHIKIGQRLRIPESEKIVAEKKATANADKGNATNQAEGTHAATTKVVSKAEVPTSAKPVASTPVEKQATEGSTYVVEKGDNPYNIAKRFKINYEELLKVNHITDPTKLQIGQKLRIPASQGGTN